MRVSVIIPCFDVEEYIEECVASVISQTYSEVEIICVDNNSKDRTWQVLEKIATKFQNVSICKELNPGANAARNKGIMYAKGEWLQFLDADDLLEPMKIEHQMRIIERSSIKTGFVAGAFKRMNINGNLVLHQTIEENKFISVFKNQAGNTCSNLWSRASLMKVGGWNESLKSSQEADLMLRLILNNEEYIADSEALTIIRERATGQISQSDPIKRWNQYIDVQLDFLNKLKIRFPSEYDAYIGFYQDALMVSILILGKYSKSSADAYYKTHIKNNWVSSGSFGFNTSKVILIKWFGLKNYLRIITLVK